MDNNLEKIETKNNEIEIQQVQALYFNPDVIRESGVQLHRLDHRNHRNYFTVNENNQLDKIYTSVTTFTKAVLPTGEGLLNWLKNKTPEEQSAILKSSSTYGTLMDILFNKMIIAGTVDDIDRQIRDFTMSQGLYNISLSQWTDQLKKDCLSFAQFVSDYDVKPILVSCPLKSDNLMIAGTLDLLCEMNDRILTKTDIKKGVEVNRIKAIVDYKAKIGDMTLKSERNSFYDAECLQLQLYKKLYNDTFEIYDSLTSPAQVNTLYNFSPKNWRTSPDYNLKCWNNTKVYDKMKRAFDLYFMIWEIDNEDSERNITVIDNSISLKGFETQFRKISLTEYINKNLQEESK
jgi:hypothetical protein